MSKTPEEKAREYATKKLIYPPLLVATARMKIAVSNVTFNAYKSGYESALHSSRWRNASEELPDIGIWVNVKDSENDIGCIHITTEFELKVITNYYKFWKPID